MPSEPKHVLIARPAGLPGYAPREWCAACGKSSSNSAVLKCTSAECPNTCHIACLGEIENFNCAQVQTLRTALTILDKVIYVDTAQGCDQEEVTEDSGDDNDELLQLGSHELVAIIKRLQTDITRKNNILSFFTSFTQDIAKHRDALVTVLQFIDNISATKSSLEELEVKSVACSARPNRIDEDWNQELNSNSQLQAWWTSDKPRKLKKVCQLEDNNNQGTIPGSISHRPQPRETAARGTVQNSTPETFSFQQNHNRPISSTTSARNSSPNHNRRNKIGNKQQNNPNHHYPNHRNNQVNNRQFNHIPLHRTTTPVIYCNYCRRSGHTEDICLRKKSCNYCHRQGHQIQDCRTRQNEERQERFFRNLASEQAQNNAVLVQSLHGYFAQSTPNIITSGAGTWQGPSTYPPYSQQYPNSHPHFSTNQPSGLLNNVSQQRQT